MYFRSSKRQRGLDGPSLRSGAAVSVESERAPGQWAAWRRAAQDVGHAWQEWSASDAPGRPELYRRYVSALTDEARAATALEDALGQVSKS